MSVKPRYARDLDVLGVDLMLGGGFRQGLQIAGQERDRGVCRGELLVRGIDLAALRATTRSFRGDHEDPLAYCVG